MKNKHESKIKYEAKGNPYLVISQKDEFGQIHHFYKLSNFDHQRKFGCNYYGVFKVSC